MRYEIEPVTVEGDWFYSMVATLTGHEADVIQVHDMGKRNGKGMRDLFRALGFNCSERFIPFDPETQWPCVMRIPHVGHSGWWCLVYFEERLYVFSQKTGTTVYPAVFKHQFGCYWLCWFGNAYRITSMMQVWI